MRVQCIALVRFLLAPDDRSVQCSILTCSSAATDGRTRTSAARLFSVGVRCPSPELPGRHIREVLVVAQRLAVGRLAILRGNARRTIRCGAARRGTSARPIPGNRPPGRPSPAPGSAPRRSPGTFTFSQNSARRSPGSAPALLSGSASLRRHAAVVPHHAGQARDGTRSTVRLPLMPSSALSCACLTSNSRLTARPRSVGIDLPGLVCAR